MTQQVNELKEAMRRFHPGSRPNNIASLELDESYSEAIRFETLPAKGSFDMAAVTEDKRRLKEAMATARVRAIERTGHNYVVEMGQFFTASDDIVVTCVVTRIA